MKTEHRDRFRSTTRKFDRNIQLSDIHAYICACGASYDTLREVRSCRGPNVATTNSNILWICKMYVVVLEGGTLFFYRQSCIEGNMGVPEENP